MEEGEVSKLIVNCLFSLFHIRNCDCSFPKINCLSFINFFPVPPLLIFNIPLIILSAEKPILFIIFLLRIELLILISIHEIEPLTSSGNCGLLFFIPILEFDEIKNILLNDKFLSYLKLIELGLILKFNLFSSLIILKPELLLNIILLFV